MFEDDEDQLYMWFDKHENQQNKFEKIPKEQRRHDRPDLCAMLYLHEKLGGKDKMITASEHDQIWFEFDNLDKLTEEDVIYLLRCGVFYDIDNLSMNI